MQGVASVCLCEKDGEMWILEYCFMMSYQPLDFFLFRIMYIEIKLLRINVLQGGRLETWYAEQQKPWGIRNPNCLDSKYVKLWAVWIQWNYLYVLDLLKFLQNIISHNDILSSSQPQSNIYFSFIDIHRVVSFFSYNKLYLTLFQTYKLVTYNVLGLARREF